MTAAVIQAMQLHMLKQADLLPVQLVCQMQLHALRSCHKLTIRASACACHLLLGAFLVSIQTSLTSPYNMITSKVDGHQDRLELQVEDILVRLPCPDIVQSTLSNTMFTLLMSSSSTGFLGLSTGFNSTGEAASKGCRTLVQS